MEFLTYAGLFGAQVFLSVATGLLMNACLSKRGITCNPCIPCFVMPPVITALLFVGGFSMWTVKGMALAMILLYASMQDLADREADDCLSVMLLILALVNFGDVSIGSMLMGALGVFVPQMAVVMISHKEGIGGADIKLSTAALSLGFYGGVMGYGIGMVLAVVFQTIRNRIQKRSMHEPFPLIPFLSAGLMIGYFI